MIKLLKYIYIDKKYEIASEYLLNTFLLESNIHIEKFNFIKNDLINILNIYEDSIDDHLFKIFKIVYNNKIILNPTINMLFLSLLSAFNLINYLTNNKNMLFIKIFDEYYGMFDLICF